MQVPVTPTTPVSVPRAPAVAAGAGSDAAAPAEPEDVFSLARPRTQADIRQLISTPAGAAPDIDNLPFGVELEMEGFNYAKGSAAVKQLEAWDVNPKVTQWTMVTDGSLAGRDQGTGGEAVSPVMVLRGGKAQAQITKIMSDLKALGGKTSVRCGLHVHVDASRLGARGLANLMKMALEQEHALFKLAQNGQPSHRATQANASQSGYQTCRPLGVQIKDAFGVLHADSSDEFRNAFYPQMPANSGRAKLPPEGSNQPFVPDRKDPARYFDVNFNSFWYRGTIEFRVFNATDDPQQVMDSVRLAIGMVSAAASGDYTYLANHPLTAKEPDAPVSREAFDYFLSRVAPDSGMRERLTQMFIKGGGKFIEDAPIGDPHVLSAVALIEQGCRFESNGKAITSPFEVVSELQAGHRAVRMTGHGESATTLKSLTDLQVAVKEAQIELRQAFADVAYESYQWRDAQGAPLKSFGALWRAAERGEPVVMANQDGHQITLQAAQVEPVLLAQSGRWTSLPAAAHQRFEDATALMAHGVVLHDAHGSALSAEQAAILAERDGAVVATQGHDEIPVSNAPDGLPLADLRALHVGPALPESISSLGDALRTLSEHGYQFKLNGSAASTAALTVALQSGRPVVAQSQDGTAHNISSLADLRPLVVDARAAMLPPDKRARYVEGMALAASRGYTFATDGKPLADASDAQYLALTSDACTLKVSMPGVPGAMAVPTRHHLQALTAAGAILSPALGAVVVRHVIPRLLQECERGAVGPAGLSHLGGALCVTDASGAVETYQLRPARERVDITGPDTDVSVSLSAASVDGSPVVALRNNADRAAFNPTFVNARLIPAPTRAARFELAPQTELWTVGGESGVRAIFEEAPQPRPAPQGNVRNLGQFPPHHFESVAGDAIKIPGFRTTNENSTAFPHFSVRGGAYLGAGSSQNYDHITTARSELAFLTDADPNVAADHRGVLALVGAARNPADFVSMLFGVRPQAGDEALSVRQLLESYGKRPSDAAFVTEIQNRLSASLGAEQVGDAMRVINESRATFLGVWTKAIQADHQCLWLTDADRFAHLQFLQNAGRIVVRNADLAGEKSLSSIAHSIHEWNRLHYPPLEVNVVYLSNAEQWIHNGNNQKANYKQLTANLTSLPLGADGVILRTGDATTGGVTPKTQSSAGSSWTYDTLPMSRYLAAAKVNPGYVEINKACAGHVAEAEAVETARRDTLLAHFAERLQSAGWTLEGRASVDAMARGELVVRDAAGRPFKPANHDEFNDAVVAATDRMTPEMAQSVHAYDQFAALGIQCKDGGGTQDVTSPLALWKTLRAPLAKPTDARLWLVTPGGERIRIDNTKALLDFVSTAADRVQAERTLRSSLEADVRSLADAGVPIAFSGKADDAETLRQSWLTAQLSKDAALSFKDTAELQAAARLQRRDAGMTEEERAFAADFDRVRQAGWEFTVNGRPLATTAQVHLALERGTLQAKRPRTRVEGATVLPASGDAWRVLSGVSGNPSRLTDGERAGLDALRGLFSDSVAATADGKALNSPEEAMVAFPKAALSVNLPTQDGAGRPNADRATVTPTTHGGLVDLGQKVHALRALVAQGYGIQVGPPTNWLNRNAIQVTPPDWLNNCAFTLVSPLGVRTPISKTRELVDFVPTAAGRIEQEKVQKAALDADARCLVAAGVGLGFTTLPNGEEEGLRRCWAAAGVEDQTRGILTLQDTAQMRHAARIQRRDADLTADEQTWLGQYDRLTSRGWRFQSGGQFLNSPAAVWLALENGTLQALGATATPCSKTDGWRVLCALNDDNLNALTADEQQRRDAFDALAELDAVAVRGEQPLKSTHEAMLAWPNVGVRLPLPTLTPSLVQSSDTAQLAALAKNVDALRRLETLGYRFSGDAMGRLDVRTPQGEAITLGDSAALQAFVPGAAAHAEEERALKATLEADARTLADAGVKVAFAQPVADGPLEALHRNWLAPILGEAAGTVRDVAELQTMARLQRRDASCSDEQRAFLQQYDHAVGQGWQFVADGQPLKTAAEVWQARRHGTLRVGRDASTTWACGDADRWRVLAACAGDPNSALTEEEKQRLQAIQGLYRAGASASVERVALRTPEEALLEFPAPEFHLPRRVQWGLLPHRNVRVDDTAALQLLSQRVQRT